MRKLIFLSFAVTVGLAISTGVAPLAQAQSIVTGELTGVVTDPTSASIANGTITLRSDATGGTQKATTNTAGEFRFPQLRPGLYTFTVEAAGFQVSKQRVKIDLGQVASVKVQLGLQSQTQVVEVSEAATLMQSDNANLATTYDSLQLENLPAPGNDITSYAFTAPGVTVSTGGGYGNFSVFGLPGVSNLFTINGTDNMDPYLNLNNSGASNLTLGANEIQEAAVVMNGYTGQYGRQAGAQVNYVTKSGSNAFHGNAAWYYNGRVLNANDWFNNANPGNPRPFSISNEWADSFGGPIIKNKLFFYFDNEGLRYVLPGGGPVFVPTTDFSNYVLNSVQKNNPAALPFYQTALGLYGKSSGAGRAVPVTANDDPALGCGDIVDPVFGVSKPCAATFRSAVNNLNTEWLLTGRVDYNITNTDRLFFRYNMDRGVQATGTDPINPAFNANSVQPSYGGQFGYTKVIGSSMVNVLNLSASYYSALFGPPDLKSALNVFPTTFAFGDGLFSNLGGADYAYPQGRKVGQRQLIDDFSIIHGKHNFKIGANARRNYVSTYAYGSNTSGLFTFNSLSDFASGQLTAAGGSTYSQAFSNIGAEPLKMYSVGFYGQDEWKLRPNLTLTLALRLDRNSNITCDSGCYNETLAPFNQTDHTATTAYNSVIHTGLKSAFPNVEPVVWAPRVGVAYNIRRSTVIRGGFGVFSDLYQGLIADRLITNSPAVASFTTGTGTVALNNPNSAFASVANSAAAFQRGFSSGATLAQLQSLVPLGFAVPNFNTVANKLLNPKYLEWNFEVQQQLTQKVVLSVNYVGNHGYDEINQTLLANAYAPKGFAGLPTTAPDARFGQIRELNNAGFSNYDGLVTSLRWRMGSQFSGQFNYTLGHALDTCSNSCLEPFNALTAVSLRYQVNPVSLRSLNYSNADYDTRHTISANYVYSMKNYFQNSMLKGAFGGWTVAGTFLFHSGYPFSIINSGVRTGQVNNASGIATQTFLADYIGGSGYTSCTTPNISCYSTSDFATRTNQHDFGNIPRNSFRGPGYFDTDMNVNKTFIIMEKYKLLVGMYFFNILNHPNFDLPVNNLALGNFGQITNTVSAPTSAYGSFQGSAVSGRVIQTQIKFTF